MIELNGLSKFYNGTRALYNVSLFIQEGEIFGIIGTSGAGKSTLLRMINLLENPDQGEVIVDNQILTQLKPRHLRQARHKIGMIFQHFNLLNAKTVYDNIALPMKIQGINEAEIREKIGELLKLVGLEDKSDAYPNQLSGGQKQRVAIARALSCSPKILLCDEPTSALDPSTTQSILDLLKKINTLYGITIVIITHEMDVIKQICHTVAVIKKGEILEITPLANIFDQPNETRKMLYTHLCPALPSCLQSTLHPIPNNHPLLRLFFAGEATTIPFISQCSRDLNLDINILIANIDRFHGLSCGVLIVQLNADEHLLNQFIFRCNQAYITVEVLGYVYDNDF